MLEQLEKYFEQWHDDIVENDDNDDALFASSYLKSLFSTMLYEYQGKVMNEEMFKEIMEQLLLQHKNELSPEDFVAVKAYYIKFVKKYLN